MIHNSETVEGILAAIAELSEADQEQLERILSGRLARRGRRRVAAAVEQRNQALAQIAADYRKPLRTVHDFDVLKNLVEREAELSPYVPLLRSQARNGYRRSTSARALRRAFLSWKDAAAATHTARRAA